MRPEEEIHRFLKEKLGFQGPGYHWWPGWGPLWPHAPARPKHVLRYLWKRSLDLGPPSDVPHTSPPAGPGVGGFGAGGWGWGWGWGAGAGCSWAPWA